MHNDKGLFRSTSRRATHLSKRLTRSQSSQNAIHEQRKREASWEGGKKRKEGGSSALLFFFPMVPSVPRGVSSWLPRLSHVALTMATSGRPCHQLNGQSCMNNISFLINYYLTTITELLQSFSSYLFVRIKSAND